MSKTTIVNAINLTQTDIAANAGKYVATLAFEYMPKAIYVVNLGKAASVAWGITNLAVASPIIAGGVATTFAAGYTYEHYYRGANHQVSTTIAGSVLYGIEILSRLNVIHGIAASVVALSDPAVNLTRAAFMAAGIALPLEATHIAWMGIRIASHIPAVSRSVNHLIRQAGHQAIDLHLPVAQEASWYEFLTNLKRITANAALHRGFDQLIEKVETFQPSAIADYMRAYTKQFISQMHDMMMAVVYCCQLLHVKYVPDHDYVMVSDEDIKAQQEDAVKAKDFVVVEIADALEPPSSEVGAAEENDYVYVTAEDTLEPLALEADAADENGDVHVKPDHSMVKPSISDSWVEIVLTDAKKSMAINACAA